MDTKVAVGESDYGWAVFARRDFIAGEKIARVAGEVFSAKEHESEYCIDLADGTVLEPTEPFRYLNHCCDPNCELIILKAQDGRPQVWLFAINQVESGEELTIDYAWEAEVAIPCFCNSVVCRGWIVDKDEVDVVQGSALA